MIKDDRLADLVNQEPVVFMDCTQGELMGAFILGFAVGFIIGIPLGISIDFIMFGIMTGLIIALGVSWGTMIWLRHIRQKYYLTWFKEKLFLFKFYTGLLKTDFINITKRFGKGSRRE